jgi:hypothetical protein
MRKRSIVAGVAVAVGLLAATIVTVTTAHAGQGAFVQIANAVSGKCMTPQLGGSPPLMQWTCGNEAKQLWLPVNLNNGYFQYVNKESGLCLWTNGTIDSRVSQSTCDATQPTQWWAWGAADDIGHQVLYSGTGNRCLALDGVYSGRNGWPIAIHECATTSGQMWHLA